MKDIDVTIFFRKKIAGYRSLEEIFDIVIMSLDKTNVKVVEVPEKRISPKNLWTNLKWVARHRGNINHITGDIHYVAVASGSNTVLTIHDANSILNAGLLKSWMFRLLWFWIPALLVKRITTISEKSRLELERIIPFAKHKIRVIPNPYNPKLLDRNKKLDQDLIANTSKPIILHLGTKSNKNLERTIMAMEGLPYKFYIVGKLDAQMADLLAQCKIDFKSYYNLPYSEIVLLYHQCSAVVFASLYEGFGMPIIEGQLVGKPVITSNIDPMPWVAGEEGAHFVDPYNIADIRNGIVRVVEDKEYSQSLITKGLQNIKRFEPRKIAKMYEEVYQEVLES